MPIVLTVVCLKAAIPAITTYAEEVNLDTGKNKKNNQTYISADKLVTDNNTKSAEFTGNVRVTQGETRHHSRPSYNFLYCPIKKKDQQVTGEEAIQKIIATSYGQDTVR